MYFYILLFFYFLFYNIGLWYFSKMIIILPLQFTNNFNRLFLMLKRSCGTHGVTPYIKDFAKFLRKICSKRLKTNLQRKKEDRKRFFCQVYQFIFASRMSMFGGNKRDVIDICELHTSCRCRESEI